MLPLYVDQQCADIVDRHIVPTQTFVIGHTGACNSSDSWWPIGDNIP
jgi:hypothetical protein